MPDKSNVLTDTDNKDPFSNSLFIILLQHSDDIFTAYKELLLNMFYLYESQMIQHCNTTDVNDHFTSSSTINNIFSFKSTSIKDKNFWNNMRIAV